MGEVFFQCTLIPACGASDGWLITTHAGRWCRSLCVCVCEHANTNPKPSHIIRSPATIPRKYTSYGTTMRINYKPCTTTTMSTDNETMYARVRACDLLSGVRHRSNCVHWAAEAKAEKREHFSCNFFGKIFIAFSVGLVFFCLLHDCGSVVHRP